MIIFVAAPCKYFAALAALVRLVEVVVFNVFLQRRRLRRLEATHACENFDAGFSWPIIPTRKYVFYFI